MVFFTDGNTTAGQNQIVLLCGIFQRLQGSLQVVWHDAQIGHLAPCTRQQSPQEKAIRVVNGAWSHSARGYIAWHDQLITR